MPVPQNAQMIWNYLIGQGLSPNAVAGIEGNIEQESGGSASAGIWPNNYGLIQWTPANQYFSNPPSLQEQLPAILKYIDANGSVADINKHAASPQAAALWFSQNYERPKASAANNPNREQSAKDVASAAQSGNWPTAGATLTGLNANPFDLFGIPGTIAGSVAGNIGGDIASGITGAFSSFLQALGIPSIKDLLQRLGLILLGVILIILGIHIFAQGNESMQRIDLVEQGKAYGSDKVNEGTKNTPLGKKSASKTATKAGEKGAIRTGATAAVEAAAIA